MPLGDLGKLAKLTITGFKDKDRSILLGAPFVVQFNPESLSIRHESSFGQQKGVGATSAGGEWSHSPPQRLNVNLIVDGTGVTNLGVAIGATPPVAVQIKQFLDTTFLVHGDTHEPAYLRLHWGFGVLGASGFDCRLESVDINYQAFDRDGSPLHAELAAVFIKIESPVDEDKKIKRSSPDLTHRRTVIAGDTLPLLCRLIYGSASHYLRVAEANELDDFRNLEAGRELIFPPLERPRKR